MPHNLIHLTFLSSKFQISSILVALAIQEVVAQVLSGEGMVIQTGLISHYHRYLSEDLEVTKQKIQS